MNSKGCFGSISKNALLQRTFLQKEGPRQSTMLHKKQSWTAKTFSVQIYVKKKLLLSWIFFEVLECESRELSVSARGELKLRQLFEAKVTFAIFLTKQRYLWKRISNRINRVKPLDQSVRVKFWRQTNNINFLESFQLSRIVIACFANKKKANFGKTPAQAILVNECTVVCENKYNVVATHNFCIRCKF